MLILKITTLDQTQHWLETTGLAKHVGINLWIPKSSQIWENVELDAFPSARKCASAQKEDEEEEVGAGRRDVHDLKHAASMQSWLEGNRGNIGELLCTLPELLIPFMMQR